MKSLNETLNEIAERTRNDCKFFFRESTLFKDYKEKIALVNALKEAVDELTMANGGCSDISCKEERGKRLKQISKILDGGGE